MVQKTTPVRIDLSQFKLHIRIGPAADLTLHFDSPSRRFYLCVIALVVHEMKHLGRMASIPMEAHRETLVLLNRTVGGTAGSAANLIPRIYRKWKDVLPDLESGHLFKIAGRKKVYEDGAGALYRFPDAEKDAWANLFEYKGSEQNVRLRLSLDRLGAGLEDAILVYQDLRDAPAWERFIADLGQAEPNAAPRQQEPLPRAEASANPLYNLSGKPSIVVLPFVNMSQDPEQEYFSDGMSEEIINALAKLEGLKVISRTSAFYFKGEHVDLRTIGEKLKVDHVLEGSVRKAGNRIRVSAQLIRVADDTHLWAETYDRELADVFAVQDDISRAVVHNLKITLFGTKIGAIVKGHSQNIEAYDLFLKGLHFEQMGWSGWSKAIEYYENAIQADPELAMAYARLSAVYYKNALPYAVSPTEMWLKVKELTVAALKIDETNADAQESMARIKQLYEYDPSGAEPYFQRAIELDPGNSIHHDGYAAYLIGNGRAFEATATIRRALELDPLSLMINAMLYMAYYFNRQFDQAINQCRKILEFAPDDSMALLFMSMSISAKGMYDEGIRMLEKIGHYPMITGVLGYLYGRAEKREKAQKILDDLLARSKQGYYSPLLIAAVYTALKDKDKAFEWLEKAYAVHDTHHWVIKVDPMFDDLHSDPRWIKHMQKMGLAV